MPIPPAYPHNELADTDLHPIEQDRKDPDGKQGDTEDAVEAVPDQGYDPFEVDQKYLVASKSTKFYRGVLLQMILFGT